jgi:hypothetical protein
VEAQRAPSTSESARRWYPRRRYLRARRRHLWSSGPLPKYDVYVFRRVRSLFTGPRRGVKARKLLELLFSARFRQSRRLRNPRCVAAAAACRSRRGCFRACTVREELWGPLRPGIEEEKSMGEVNEAADKWIGEGTYRLPAPYALWAIRLKPSSSV